MNPFWSFGIGLLQGILLLVLAPLYSGFARVMRAKMHSRHGPPLMQNYRDIAKLMTRQEVVSEQAGWIFRFTPYVSMACMFLVALVVPILITDAPALFKYDQSPRSVRNRCDVGDVLKP